MLENGDTERQSEMEGEGRGGENEWKNVEFQTYRNEGYLDAS